MLGHNTPAGVRPDDVADHPRLAVEWLAKHARTEGRTRRAAIHLRVSPGSAGAEGYGTRLSLSASDDRERREIYAMVSLDEHRPASPETHGMESTRFKVGKGAKYVLRIPCARYSAKQLEAAYRAAIEGLRAQPEILTELARSYES